jgi:fermentation-respiration switch protein FrsA (DUF1100 family)
MGRLVRWLAAGLLAVIMFNAVFAVFQRKLIYFPGGPAGPPPPGLTAVTYPTEDGLTLSAWWAPAAAPQRDQTVLLFNGNAGSRYDRLGLAQNLNALGLNVLLTDYRGYGGNPGEPSEPGLLRDARAAQAFLTGTRQIPPNRLIYLGESLGAAVAVALAAERPPRALILRSPFASLVTLGRWHYPFLPVDWLLLDRFSSEERIERVTVPLLIVAGDQDRIVPLAESRRLYARAHPPKQLVVLEGLDHNDPALAEGPRLMQAIADFLASLPDTR